jgi:plastocyanin
MSSGSAATWMLAGAFSLGGCIVIEVLPAVEQDPVSSAGAGGSDASGGAGGADAAGECDGDASCPERSCQRASCVAGSCKYQPLVAGTPAAEQIPGDCQLLECDGSGSTISRADDGDVPADESDCTIDSCVKGLPRNVSKIEGTPCEGGVCNDRGVCVQCYAPSECPGSDSFCQMRTCMNNTCGLVFEVQGKRLPAAEQSAGDCQVLECDGEGGIATLQDDADVPVDGIACTEDLCNAGKPENPALAAGSACAQDGGVMCDGAGSCVECATGPDCGSGVCSTGLCVAPGCLDKQRNGSETDVDCGGPDCAPCALGQGCSTGTDCVTGICTGNACKAPSCTDGIKNGSETDVDCGGGCSADCAVGKGCLIGDDCATGICSENVCKGPTCTDGVKNGSETDRDCGGSCSACPVGRVCAVDGDCTTGKCRSQVCTLLNSCDSVTAEDHTGRAAVTSFFGGSTGKYTPACFKVSAGTDVTFEGSFSPHPHVGGIVWAGVQTPDPSSPFYPAVTSGSTYTWKLSTPGAYPYYCVKHSGTGYVGVVYVVR